MYAYILSPLVRNYSLRMLGAALMVAGLLLVYQGRKHGG